MFEDRTEAPRDQGWLSASRRFSDRDEGLASAIRSLDAAVCARRCFGEAVIRQARGGTAERRCVRASVLRQVAWLSRRSGEPIAETHTEEQRALGTTTSRHHRFGRSRAVDATGERSSIRPRARLGCGASEFAGLLGSGILRPSPSSAPSQLPVALDSNDLPQPFGQYTLLRRIAVGGMAEVYVAKTAGVAGFEKLAALKVIHPRLSEDEHFTQMLVEEAKIAVLLTHVNIAQTLDLGLVDGTYYIAMEFVEGADAYRVMRRCSELRKAMPIDVAAFVAAEMCNGLDYAHRKRDPKTGQPLHIVHRDISPQNVLISFAGEVKIVDFGIAKAASRSTQTEVGVIKGKYYYMSPEQAWGDPMDHRSDVFSTGVVLYELLTGRMLYQDVDVPKLLDKVRKADIPRPETRRPSIPKALSDIVMKALARRPEDRWASAGEMGQALHQFLYSTSPTFTAARLADLLALLFPEESGRQLPSAAMDALPAIESPREPTPRFELGDDESESESTRNDVLPYKRKPEAAGGAPGRSSRSTVRPPGRTSATREILPRAVRVSVPEVSPSGAWVAPVTSEPGVLRRETTSRTAPALWDEDETDLRAEADFEDSTLVDSDIARATASALAARAESPTAEVSTVDSPRGRVVVHATGTRELPAKRPFADDLDDTTNDLNQVRRSALARSSVPDSATVPRLSQSRLSERPRPTPMPSFGPAPKPVPIAASSFGSPGRRGPVASTRPAPSALGGGPERAPAVRDEPRLEDGAPPAEGASRLSAGPSPGPALSSVSAIPLTAAPPVAAIASSVAPALSAAEEHKNDSSFAFGASGGSAALAELGEPRPVPWALLGVGLLGLALLAGAVVYALVPGPVPGFEISSLPAGATVTVDGAVIGTTPIVLRDGLVVGRRYAFEVSLEGHQAASFELVASPGTDRREVVLSPLPAVLHVETIPPGARVTVGGASRGVAPRDVGGLFVGAEVEVHVDAPGHHPRTQRVRIGTPRQDLTVRLEPMR